MVQALAKHKLFVPKSKLDYDWWQVTEVEPKQKHVKCWHVIKTTGHTGVMWLGVTSCRKGVEDGEAGVTQRWRWCSIHHSVTTWVHHVTCYWRGGGRKTGCGWNKQETSAETTPGGGGWRGESNLRMQSCGCLNCFDWWRSADCWAEPGWSEAVGRLPLLFNTQTSSTYYWRIPQSTSQLAMWNNMQWSKPTELDV